MIKAEVIADSKNEFGNRLTTMVVTFPRIILAEFNTHRMLSKNSARSRAIPFEKMVKSVEENPFIPIAWQKDHKGMQGTEYLDERDSEVSRSAWLVSRNKAVEQAKYLSERGVTKQLCNRLLEPFMYHTVIVTATEWNNFFALRCPQYNAQFTWETETKVFRSKKDVIKHWQNRYNEDSEAGIVEDQRIGQPRYYDEQTWLKMNKGQAEIHMMALAEAMWGAINESIPKELKSGEWHIPFGDNIDIEQLDNIIADDLGGMDTDVEEFEQQIQNKRSNYLIKIATARCARISYTVVGEEGKPDNYANDIKLHDRLATSGHWSPFEHCAKVMNSIEFSNSIHCEYVNYEEAGDLMEQKGWSGNFRGFQQYRKMFNNENITK